MQLKLKRSQRTAGMLGGKIVFALDARTDFTAEESALVGKYGLGKLSVYDSEARKRHGEQGFADLDAKGGGAVGSLWRTARGATRLAMSALSLHVTIDSLARGQHIECKDLDELMGAEAAILEACRNVKSYLETALTFDGREDVLEF